MNWRVYQRIFEVSAVVSMITGVIMMWERMDPNRYWVYGGFMLLACGKLTEAINVHDPKFKIVKVFACVCIFLPALLSILYGVRTIAYIMIPLIFYYALHYRLMFQEKKA